MIKQIDRRLLAWAEASICGEYSGPGRSSGFDPLAGIGGTGFGSCILVSVEVDEMESAVVALPEGLRECVKELYLHDESTMEQKAKNLLMSINTLRRRRDKAHELIFQWLEDQKVSRRRA
jgi:hypothetical protein|tara:strand:- start:111 stop:470 length:360 start_codon:yes stop_codon:yes gene_type:complete